MVVVRPFVALTLLALIAAHTLEARAQPAAVVPITVDGESQNLLFLSPAAAPTAAVVMFPGGDGRIGIGQDGSIARPGNFLIRTREQWLAYGFLYIAVDAAPGRAGQRGDRVGPANQHAIVEIVRAVRQRTRAPIWLIGTSAGAAAAIMGTALLPQGTIRGAVISSAVTLPGPRDSVFEAPLQRIGVPVLIQVHRDDSCRITPPAGASSIKAALKAAPVVEVQVFAGGLPPRSAPCEPFAPHGFYGIESQVVSAAASWIRAH